MTPSTSTNSDTKRRFERLLQRERLRVALKIGGVVLVGIGVGTAILPFGPSLSNPAVVPKADPNAGLWLLQMLPPKYTIVIGLGLALVGGVVLLCSALLRTGKEPGGNDRRV